MGALDRAPETLNFLSPLGFRFILSRSPEINYFVQSVTLPDMQLDVASIPTPFNRITLPGDKVTYGELQISFKVDENLVNFMHIYNWIADLAKQKNYDGYKALASGTAGSTTGIFSDATLVIMTSGFNPNKQVVFRNIYPNNLTSLTFDSTLSDVNYLQATASFNIQNYEIISA